MDVGFRPRMSKDEVQKIIDERLSIILEKELQQVRSEAAGSEENSADSSQQKTESQKNRK